MGMAGVGRGSSQGRIPNVVGAEGGGCTVVLCCLGDLTVGVRSIVAIRLGGVPAGLLVPC